MYVRGVWHGQSKGLALCQESEEVEASRKSVDVKNSIKIYKDDPSSFKVCVECKDILERSELAKIKRKIREGKKAIRDGLLQV